MSGDEVSDDGVELLRCLEIRRMSSDRDDGKLGSGITREASARTPG